MDTMNEMQEKAVEVIRMLVEGNYGGACGTFDATMTGALPEARMKEYWEQLIGQVGAFQGITAIQASEQGEARVFILTCPFERSTIDFRVAFNRDGQVSGLNFQIAASATPYQAPEYVRAGSFHDVEITVGSGEWALPGTLSMPEGNGPFPAVVLVHGSGPQDRDETIGPNRPFRDIAEGLASQGIAVLRYEKRTKAHGSHFTPEIIAKLTVQEEVVDDALAAVALLRGTPGIDPRRIYVLGHSLGGGIAPRIGQQDHTIAGLIVMAGMTRPLEDAILEQFTYLYGLAGEMSDAQKAELEQLKVKVARVKSAELSDQTPASDLPLGMSPAYLLDLRGYQPAEVAKALAQSTRMRILVLQGGRDYQVTVAGDFPFWQRALGNESNATLKVYPKLFHLFIEGEGPSTPQEYMKEGHVSGEVIEDMARWIEET
ncbi:MAG TPA: alpha/beta fold hydrolase [Armatimonadota bacterium]